MGQSKVLYSIGRVVCTPIYKLCYRYKAINNHTIPESGGCILACNHISFADPVLLGLCQKRRLFFMAKSELFKSPASVPQLNYLLFLSYSHGRNNSIKIIQENISRCCKIFPQAHSLKKRVTVTAIFFKVYRRFIFCRQGFTNGFQISLQCISRL